MHRRDFLRTTALGTLAIATQLPESLLANPYGKPIGLQLYTVRDQLQKDPAGTIQQVAKIGYKELEIGSWYETHTVELARILSDNRVTAPSSHYLLQDVKTGWDRHVENAKQFGLKYMVNAILLPQERKSFDDYKRIVDVFNKAGETAQKAGIQFC